MPRPESDADVLNHVARRLFAESQEEFRAAHEKWAESLDVFTTDEYLRCFGEAIEQERHALEKQYEAMELRKLALNLRAKIWEDLKAKSAGKPSWS